VLHATHTYIGVHDREVRAPFIILYTEVSYTHIRATGCAARPVDNDNCTRNDDDDDDVYDNDDDDDDDGGSVLLFFYDTQKRQMERMT